MCAIRSEAADDGAQDWTLPRRPVALGIYRRAVLSTLAISQKDE